VGSLHAMKLQPCTAGYVSTTPIVSHLPAVLFWPSFATALTSNPYLSPAQVLPAIKEPRVKPASMDTEEMPLAAAGGVGITCWGGISRSTGGKGDDSVAPARPDLIIACPGSTEEASPRVSGATAVGGTG
jgi:hypothetical protein